MDKSFKEAMDFRHACKVFDETKKINEKDMLFILEAGRNSPSSFGQEGWKFLVITNDELKQKIRPHCWNQPQITTCSHLVIILAAIKALKPESGIPATRFQRRDLPEDKIKTYIEVYKNHLEKTGILDSDETLYAWSSKQCYIAAANMMTAAAVKGIDSCPIEGMDRKKVEEVLRLDTTKFQVALILPFGYRANPQPKRIRRDLDDICEFIE